MEDRRFLDTSYDLETGRQTLDHYEEWAETYDQEVGVENAYAQPTRCAKALTSVVEPGGRILDVGCGTGLSGRALAEAGFTNLDGCDFSPPMLERAAATGVYGRLFESDLNEGLDVADDTYDHAAAVGVFSFGHIRPSALRGPRPQALGQWAAGPMGPWALWALGLLGPGPMGPGAQIS